MEGGHDSGAWGSRKVTRLYKKGTTMEAVSYRSIFVNPLMHLAFMKIVWRRYAIKIIQSLDEHRYVMKGRTTTMRCLNMMHAVRSPRSPRQDGFVCMLDVAKAFPSVPHTPTPCCST